MQATGLDTKSLLAREGKLDGSPLIPVGEVQGDASLHIGQGNGC